MDGAKGFTPRGPGPRPRRAARADADLLQHSGSAKDSRRAIGGTPRPPTRLPRRAHRWKQRLCSVAWAPCTLDWATCDRVGAVRTRARDGTRAGSGSVEVAALNGLATVRTATSDAKEAVDYCIGRSRSRAGAATVGTGGCLAEPRDCRGWTGQYQESSALYEKALAIRRQLSDYGAGTGNPDARLQRG